MITISLCMIVKDEADILSRCLDSVAGLMDEIIIVDTGSLDNTKEVAKKYADKIFDFKWIGDFSAARNFAFSHASMEYIYSADADEVLSPENIRNFQTLKETLLPQVDIVQMKYANQLASQTVYNFDEEYRPKLFKRQRDFLWEGAVHEMVRLEPLVYDSDIVITHLPKGSHGKRDLKKKKKEIASGKILTKRLKHMYATELYMTGDKDDFIPAVDYFKHQVAAGTLSQEELVEACCIIARGDRLQGEIPSFFKHTTKVIASEGCSEICCELALYYEQQNDLEEAVIWYYNAAYETQPALSLKSGEREALEGLIRCYEKLGMEQQAKVYADALHQIMENGSNPPQ